jgi:putative flippase GtrA
MKQLTHTARQSGKVDLRTAGRFGLVGVINTSLDFGMFSAFRLLGLGLLLANVVSASLGMAFSFFANRRFVFSSAGGWKKQAVLFLAGTAFSMYVLQNLVMFGVSRYFPALLESAVVVARWLGVRSDASTMLVRSNTAKLAATGVSMTWNFCFYRWAVFTPGQVSGEGDARPPA